MLPCPRTVHSYMDLQNPSLFMFVWRQWCRMSFLGDGRSTNWHTNSGDGRSISDDNTNKKEPQRDVGD